MKLNIAIVNLVCLFGFGYSALAAENPLRGDECTLSYPTEAFALTGSSLGTLDTGTIIRLVTLVPPRDPNASPQGSTPLRMVERRYAGEMVYVRESDYTEQCQKN